MPQRDKVRRILSGTYFARISALAGLLTISGLIQDANASKIVQVMLPDISSLGTLQRTGLDITSISEGGLAEVVLMNDHDKADLDASGLRYFVSLENVEQYYSSRLNNGRDDMDGYPTFAEIMAECNQLHEDYPDVVGEPFSIGQTVERRELWVVPVSDNPDDDEEGEAEIFIASAIHCREVITPLITLNVIRQLAEGYGHDDRITALVDGRKAFFMPVVNPDGYAYNEQTHPNGGGMWRKNRKRNPDGTIGVDLNRNFGEHWGYDDEGSSPEGADETYRGEEAFSELETDAIRDFANSHHLGISIFFHSWGDLCLYPFGYEFIQAPDQSLLAALSARMISENRYLPGTGWEVIYRTNGDSDDWFYGTDEHDPVMAYTFEVGLRSDSFWPPLNRVETLVNENLENCLTAIEFSDRPSRVLQPAKPRRIDATIIDDSLHVKWSRVAGHDNPAVSYKVIARLPGQAVVDDAPDNDQRWDRVNFSISQVEHHSGANSYRAALAQPMATMTLKEPIVAPDTLRAWVNYNLRAFRGHYAALEASTDGWTWTPLAGQHTVNQVINQKNLGPGITDASNGWRQTKWALGEFAGKSVKLRFRYYSMYIAGNNEFFYVDDISPMPTYQWVRVLAEGIQDTIWTTEAAFDENVEFAVQAVDADGDISFPTEPVNARIGSPAFVLHATAGWSIISVPVTPDAPEVQNFFGAWLDADILKIVKDGYGRFFLPAWDFDQIGSVNPLLGYTIKLDEADTLVIAGQDIPEDMPMPLDMGWNLIAYLPRDPLGAEEAWDDIHENILVAKDHLGRFWLPERNFINLGLLRAGNGYLVKLRSADTLTYPLPQGGRVASLADDSYYDGFQPPSPDNMSLLIELPKEIRAGEIRLIDLDGNLSGLAKVDGSGRVGVAAWGEEEAGREGFADGEAINAIWRDPAGNEQQLLISDPNGSIHYQTDGVGILSATLDDAAIPTTLAISVSPNPFNGKTTARITLPFAGQVKVSIYDNTGRLASEITDYQSNAVTQYLPLNLEQLPAGLYICRLSLRNEESSHAASVKLLLLR